MILRGTVYFGNGEYFCHYRPDNKTVIKDKEVIQFSLTELPEGDVVAARQRLVARMKEEASRRGMHFVRGIDIDPLK